MHAKDLYTPCFLFTEVVRVGSRRFAVVDPPGTSTVICTLHTLFPLLSGSSRRFCIFEPSRTHAKDLYTPCYLCSEVVRGGSLRLNLPELVHRYPTDLVPPVKKQFEKVRSSRTTPNSCMRKTSTHLAISALKWFEEVHCG